MTVQYTGHMIQTETYDNKTALPLVGVYWSLYTDYTDYKVIILSIITIKNTKLKF